MTPFEAVYNKKPSFGLSHLGIAHRRQVLENIIKAGGVAGECHLGGLGVTERFT